MKLRMPTYYKKFNCIAGDCRDSCCIGWEIDIDRETWKKYSEMEGEFGKRLRENILDGAFILDGSERCPFLNSEGLCDIITEIGEENLCGICNDHPRYFQWFKGLKEGGIGLACEESARIILTDEEKFGYFEVEIEEEDCEDYDEELYGLLVAARQDLLDILEDRRFPLNQRLSHAVIYAEILQKNIDKGEYVSPRERDFIPCLENFYIRKVNLKGILEFMAELEPMEEGRPQYIKRQIEKLEESSEAELPKEAEKYLERIAVYFLWRYFISGVFDNEILSKAKLIQVSVEVIGNMFRLKLMETGELSEGDCILLAKTYSKEIEYSQDNIDELLYVLS